MPKLDFFDDLSGVGGVNSSERTTLKYLLARVKDIKSCSSGLQSVLESLRRVQQMDLNHNEKQAVEVHLNFLQLQALLKTDNTGLSTSPYRLRQCITLGWSRIFWNENISSDFPHHIQQFDTFPESFRAHIKLIDYRIVMLDFQVRRPWLLNS